MDALRVCIACSGLGHVKRGYESLAIDLHRQLVQGRPQAAITLFGGGIELPPDARRLRCLTRKSLLASAIARLLPKRFGPYDVEQLTFALPLFWHLRREKPDILYLSDRTLCTAAFRARNAGYIPPLGIVFLNAAPYTPPFYYSDCIQHPTPFPRDASIAFGEDAMRHVVLPYGVDRSRFEPARLRTLRTAVRDALNIPHDATVIVSSAHLSRSHKRMDHLIRETAQLSSRPYLVLAGERTAETPEIEELGRNLIGSERLRITSFPQSRVQELYACGDVFVLASLTEGLPRAALEAIASGMRVVLHDAPLFRWVGGALAHYVDMTRPSSLYAAIQRILDNGLHPSDAEAQAAAFAARYDWSVLLPQYWELFRAATSIRYGM